MVGFSPWFLLDIRRDRSWASSPTRITKLEYRNSSYVLNHPDYSMIKTEAEILLEHSPSLSEFLGHIDSDFDGTYLIMFGAT